MKNKKQVVLAMMACFCMLVSVLLACVPVEAADPADYNKTVYTSPRVPTADGMKDIGTLWVYEYSTGKNTDFALMTKDKELGNIADQQAFYAGAPTEAGGAKATLQYLYGNLELQPNYYGTSINAVQTFVVPETGKLSVDATTVVRHFGMDATQVNYTGYEQQNVHIAVYLNETKVWPAGDAWETVGYDSAVFNKLDVAALPEMNVTKGDKLRFVVNSGTDSNTFYYNDWVRWPVSINMFVKKEATTTATTTTTANLSADYNKTAYVAPTRLWGTDSVGDVAGIGTRWIYEVSSNKDGVFVAMTRKQNTDKPSDGALFADEACTSYAQLESLWSNGSLYLNVGWFAGSRDVSQTFVVPEDGIITTDAVIVERHYALADTVEQSAEIAIFLNDRKVWPTGDAWAEVGTGSSPINKLTVPALSEMAVEKGDKLRFVVNAGKNANYDDRVQWPVAVNMFVKKPTTMTSEATTTTDASVTTTTQVVTTTTKEETTTTTTKVDLSNAKPIIYRSPLEATEAGMKDIGRYWIYEYSTAKDTNFIAMDKVKGLEGIRDQEAMFSGAPAEAGGAKASLQYLYGKLQLQPNYYGYSINAVQTFVVPKTGELSVDATTVLRHFGLGENEVNYSGYEQQNVHIAVYLNETKVWPAGDEWASVGYDSSVFNKLSVPAISRMEVNEGDKLRFVVNSGTDSNTFHYNDWVEWPVNVKLYTAENIENSGSNEDDDNGEKNPDTGVSNLSVVAAMIFAVAALGLGFSACAATKKV